MSYIPNKSVSDKLQAIHDEQQKTMKAQLEELKKIVKTLKS